MENSMSFGLKWTQAAIVTALLGAPFVASANNVVFSPLLAQGVDQQDASNLSALLVSELDFMPDFDSVTELPGVPSSLNTACLSNTSCLATIAASEGGDTLVAGIASSTGDNFGLDLVYFDAGSKRIIRRGSFTLPTNPVAVADGMTAVATELLTGVKPKEVAANDVTVADFDFDSEDIDFDLEAAAVEEAARERREAETRAREAEDARRRAAEEERLRVEAEERRRAEEEARRQAEEEARRRAEEDERRRAEDERRRQEEEARLAAVEEQRRREAEETRRRDEETARLAAEEQRRSDDEARRRAEDDLRRREEEAALAIAEEEEGEEEFDLSAISFGSATNEITVEEIDAMISFAPASSASSSSSSSSDYAEAEDFETRSSSSSRSNSRSSSRDDDDIDPDDDFDLDGGRGNRRTSDRRSTSTTKRATSTDTKRGPFRIALRGAYSRYFTLNFIATPSIEVSFPATKNLAIFAGFQVFSTPRTGQEGSAGGTEWNWIYPLNLGFHYMFHAGIAHPYIGADMIAATYTTDPSTQKSAWTIGARARGGVDIMIHDNFGFNVDVGLGFWSGNKWVLVEEGVGNIGFLPQVQAGFVVAF